MVNGKNSMSNAVIYIVELSLLIKMTILTYLLVLKRISMAFLWMFSFKNKSNVLINFLSFKIQGLGFANVVLATVGAKQVCSRN